MKPYKIMYKIKKYYDDLKLIDRQESLILWILR